MDLTEKQRAYHLRKMRTATKRFDTNKDGYISLDDFVLTAERQIEYGKLTKEHAELAHKTYMKVAKVFDLKPGMKIPLEEMAQIATSAIDFVPYKERKAMVQACYETLFDVIDLNKDGHISLEEFKVYFQVYGITGISDEEVSHAFEAIDTNKDGVISREEFSAAAVDFYMGVEETELSKAFLGPLED